MFKTMLDEMVEEGSYVPTHEQLRLEQVEVDQTQARGRMLILNKKTSQLNSRQKDELERHNSLGGSHSIKPYCSSDMPDFDYKEVNTTA